MKELKLNSAFSIAYQNSLLFARLITTVVETIY